MRDRRGFTVVELIIVIIVGVILAGVAIRSLSEMQTRMSVKQARQVFVSMHARARAQAIEFGQRTRLRIDTSGDSAWLSRNDSTLEVVKFRDNFGVNVSGASSSYTVCMNARGFADSSCNSFSSTVTLSFVMADQTSSLRLLPLGQILY
jgi:prepilin-type N-terminal cleavage/methylation domain-containing protein